MFFLAPITPPPHPHQENLSKNSHQPNRKINQRDKDMKHTMSNTLFFFFFFFLVLAFWPHKILAQDDLGMSMLSVEDSELGAPLIAKVCDHAMYKNLCSSSLLSVPESKDADLFELTAIALKVAAENATEIKKYVDKLLNESYSDPYSKLDLADCSENYQDAKERIEDSVKALDNKGYNDVNTWVTAAMADAESCEEGFRDHPDHNSPLTDKSAVFNQLCNTALTITNLLVVGI